MSLLEIQAIEAGYGAQQVLRGTSLRLGKGEIAALIGPNSIVVRGSNDQSKKIDGGLTLARCEVINFLCGAFQIFIFIKSLHLNQVHLICF